MSHFHHMYLVCFSVLPCILASRVWLTFQLSGQVYASDVLPRDPVSTLYYILATGIRNDTGTLKKTLI